MTVIPINSRRCPVCHRHVGDLTRHRPACARDHESFYKLGEDDWKVVERSACHAVDAPAGGVTDLAMARVMLFLERGGVIAQGGGPYRWRAEGTRLSKIEVGKTVDEMIRLGIAKAISFPVAPQIASVVVVPAPVHLRSAESFLEPKCDAQALRYRLVDHASLADCPSCLA